MKRIILMGAPGSGKGTQADYMEKELGYLKISTGDLIRAEVKSESKIGLKVKDIIEDGQLVSDDIILELVQNRLNQSRNITGYILDGIPRTIGQAEALAKIKSSSEIAVYLKIEDENVVVNRIMSRLTCQKCGAIYSTLSKLPKNKGICDICQGELITRKDDNLEAIKNRIAVYRKDTMPVINYYRDRSLLYEVNASAEIEQISQKIKKVVT